MVQLFWLLLIYYEQNAYIAYIDASSIPVKTDLDQQLSDMDFQNCFYG